MRKHIFLPFAALVIGLVGGASIGYFPHAKSGFSALEFLEHGLKHRTIKFHQTTRSEFLAMLSARKSRVLSKPDGAFMVEIIERLNADQVVLPKGFDPPEISALGEHLQIVAHFAPSTELLTQIDVHVANGYRSP